MSGWTTVFRKEFLEVWRDRRSLIQLIITPLLITPLLIAGVGKMTQSRMQEARKETINIGIVGLNNSPDIKQLIDGQNPKETLTVFVPVADQAQAENEVIQRKLRAVVMVPEDAQAAVDESRPVGLTILNDPGSDESQMAAARAKAVLENFGGIIVSRRLHEGGLPIQTAEPFRIKEKSVKGGSGAGMMMLTMFLPYILGLSAIMGGAAVAFDAVAGEKERGTLETLLVSPISRRSIVTGKFMAVATVALVNSVFSVVGMLWPFYVKLPMFAVAASGGLKLSAGAIAALFFVQMPVALLGAGLLLTISTISRNQKEAQASLMPVMLLGTIGSMLTMLLKTESPLWWALVPVTNAGLVLKQALAGMIDPTFVAVAFGSSLLYATVAIFYARSVFEKENVLLKA